MIRPLFFLVALAVATPGVRAEDADASAGVGTIVPRASPYETALAPLLQDAALRRTTFGVQVVRMSTGEEVLAHGADRPLVPASTVKVVTSAAALRALGPSHSFTTDVFTDGEVKGGVLEGNLYIQGHGDPTFTTEKLWRLLRDVSVDGITRVQGNLVFDDSYFGGDPQIPGWDKKSDLEEGPSYFPSIGALGLEFGATVIVVRPSGEVGKPAEVFLETPAGGYVELEGSVATGSARSRARLEVEREVSSSNVSYSVEGTIPLDSSAVRIRRSVPDPTAFFTGVARDLLRDVGPRVTGSLVRGVVPDHAKRVRRMYSPPLSSVLMDTNKYSSNYMAETVLRTLGAELHGEGTTEAGLLVVRAYLESIGIPASDFVLTNGSGLSRETRLSPSTLTAVLLDMAGDPRVGSEFVSSLSIAGTDGTLRRRLTDEAGRMRGKTGTLNGVHTLVGYVESDDGEMYAYAFLVNDVRGSLYPVKGVQDDFLRRLMSVPRP